MPSKKDQRHIGQKPLISEYDDEAPEDRPKGMPSLRQIKSETARWGLPDSDAEHLYDVWLMSGFKTSRGQKILDWRAAVRVWSRNGYLPSQKKVKPKPGELMSYEILDDIATWTAFKKLDVHKEGTEFKEWCEKNDRPKLVSSFIKRLNAKL